MGGEDQPGDSAPVKGFDAVIAIGCIMITGWLTLVLSPLTSESRFYCTRPEQNTEGNCVLERLHYFSRNERTEFPEGTIIRAESQNAKVGRGAMALVNLKLNTGLFYPVMDYKLDSDAEIAVRRFNEYLANQEMVSYNQPKSTDIPQKILIVLVAIGSAAVIVSIRMFKGNDRN